MRSAFALCLVGALGCHAHRGHHGQHAHGHAHGPCPHCPPGAHGHGPHGHGPAAPTPPPGEHGQHGEHGGHGGHHHRFDDPARWAAVFDNPARDAWQEPDRVLARMNLRPNARVADLGAGTGYFSVRLARAVPQGRVWALDLEPNLVQHLHDRARRENLGNLFAALCTPDAAMIPEPVDAVLVVDTYHHIEDRSAYFTRLRPRLAPGGTVVIVDFRLDAPEGPPPAMRLAPERVRAEMQAAGFVQQGDPLMLARQYVLVFAPAAP